jgi:hypothetical protein
MRVLSEEDYDAWRQGAQITAADSHGDKVLHLADGSYLKLFRIKRLITSARFFPYWERFQENAEGLARLGVPTLQVLETVDIPALNRTGVHYEPLPGRTLREVEILDEDLIVSLGSFINSLHDRGIYLRSLHLGNVVLTPEGELGLIDIADMRIINKPLSKWRRMRNLRHLARYEEDRLCLVRHLKPFVGELDKRVRPAAMELFSTPNQ